MRHLQSADAVLQRICFPPLHPGFSSSSVILLCHFWQISPLRHAFISLIFPSSSGWMLPASASHIFSSCELLKAVLGPRQCFFFPALHCGLFPLQPWQSFVINPCFLLLFQLWKIPLLMSRPLQLMTITALFRIPPAGCLSLTPGWDWTQGQSSTTWSNVKLAFGGAGGWTSWSP